METPGPPMVTTDGIFTALMLLIQTRTSQMTSNQSKLDQLSISHHIFAVYSLIKSNHSAPVFVINLFIADLILTACMLFFISPFEMMRTFSVMGIICVGFAGSYFMTCIAVKRYVLIAHPVWHRFHLSVKYFVCTSLTGWLVSLIIIPVSISTGVLIILMPFIPYAVVTVCFVGLCRSLSHSVSLTPIKQQIVLAPLFFVVISYTFLIPPFYTVFILYIKLDNSPDSLLNFTFFLYMLNPLVDCLLYVFMRSVQLYAENIIRTPHCCSRLKSMIMCERPDC